MSAESGKENVLMVTNPILFHPCRYTFPSKHRWYVIAYRVCVVYIFGVKCLIITILLNIFELMW